MSIGNGYEDIGELYADMKEIQRKERADRLAARQPELIDLAACGYVVKQFNAGLHWRIGVIDFWPSTSRWLDSRTRRNGRLADNRPVKSMLPPVTSPSNNATREAATPYQRKGEPAGT
jgi:hypothetical protein